MPKKQARKRGREYEEFVYRKFRRLFPDSIVTLDDRIRGRESNRSRQIDISIKSSVEGQEVLYIVQCKDRAKRPADIVVLGEFSAVIRDVGAAKGILICSSGFARSNFQYAKTLGIELLTVEDIESDRWSAEIQVPFVIVQKDFTYVLHLGFVGNEQLAALNRDRDIVFSFDINSLISFDGGRASMTIQEYFENVWLVEKQMDVAEASNIDILRPGMCVKIADVWVECNELVINATTKKRYYLKYLDPVEYAQLRDHVRDSVVPLNVRLGGPGQIDDSFIEVAEDDLPVAPVLEIRLEHWSAFERAQGKGPPLGG